MSANQVFWATIKDKLGDPVKTLSEAIDSALVTAFGKVINIDANEDNAMAGALAFTASTLTIASGSVAITRSNHIIAAETGTTDDLANMTTSGVSTGAYLVIRADTGDTITVKDAATGAGEIHMADNADHVLAGDDSMTLQFRGTDWFETARSNRVADTVKTFTADFTSSEQTVAADQNLDIAHGLGAIPALWTLSLVNSTGANGYIDGNELNYWIETASNDSGVTAFADATNITVITGVILQVIAEDSNNAANITTTSWRWIARAWL